MEMKKGLSTKRLMRIAALPYNHFFGNEVQKIRKEYAIPADYKEAWDWFFQEHAASGLRAAWSLFDPNPLLMNATAKTIYHTEVPLEKDIVLVMIKFQLPSYVFFRVLQYVLLNDIRCLDPQVFAPNATFEPDTRRGLPEWKITVTGITPWTTKGQWDEIWAMINQFDEFWDEFEDGRMKKVIEILKLGRSTKRPTVESYRKQMKRWSEWYQLCVIQGMSAVKALDKWEKDHPEQIDPDNPIDPSTVTRAVKDFQEIIRPVPLKE